VDDTKSIPEDIHHRTTRTVLAIFESPSSAEKAIRASPYHIPLPSSSRRAANPRLRNNLNNHNANANPNTSPNTSPSPQSKDQNLQPQPADVPNPLHPWTASDIERESRAPSDLRCVVAWSRHNHERAQERNPYHMYYKIDDMSAPFRGLRHSMGIPVRALGDCLVGRKEKMPWWKRKKIDLLNETLGMKSLWGVYEEGLKEEKMEEERSRQKDEE
jgi:hypothetical protein